MDVHPTSEVERNMQEGFVLVTTCTRDGPKRSVKGAADLEYYDEQTWKRLDPKWGLSWAIMLSWSAHDDGCL